MTLTRDLALTIVSAGVLHVHGDGAARPQRGRAEGRHVLGRRLARPAAAGPGAAGLVAALLAGAGEKVFFCFTMIIGRLILF